MLWILLTVAIVISVWFAFRKPARREGEGSGGELPLNRKSNSGAKGISITEYGDDFLAVDPIGFHGHFARSPNRRFIFACQDSDYIGGRIGGHRYRGMGRVVLIKDGQLAWQWELQRPNDGVVSDSGISAVNDWLFGDRLNGTFYVFSSDGEPIIKSHFLANLINCGINDDGSVAWCATARSDHERDSQKLVIFTTSPPKKLFKTETLYGDVSQVTISNNEILVTTELSIQYRFSMDGNILNEELANAAIDNAQIEHGSSWDLLTIVDSRRSVLNGKADSQSDEILALLDLASQRTTDERLIATIERRKGELKLEAGDKKQGLIHFRNALQLNPKIGVKRLVAKLEMDLGNNPKD